MALPTLGKNPLMLAGHTSALSLRGREERWGRVPTGRPPQACRGMGNIKALSHSLTPKGRAGVRRSPSGVPPLPPVICGSHGVPKLLEWQRLSAPAAGPVFDWIDLGSGRRVGRGGGG
ncbi:hypothetical protein AAFF_G00318990 [Aldrovandia affinis]|uniref:Uncharacterized protein n=1 Tax=Aldrovandia affinis TaxID=143900 RepID=A0AAD7SPL1_9TELE|nr:hypothetical protein AAFF_G00318990 [Aldrovandia affinis]